MARHISQNAIEGTDTQRVVTWNRDVMFASNRGCEAQVTACLTSHLISKGTERPNKVGAREITR
jgi:hypothetical protein